jgi:hypothetical protein
LSYHVEICGHPIINTPIRNIIWVFSVSSVLFADDRDAGILLLLSSYVLNGQVDLQIANADFAPVYWKTGRPSDLQLCLSPDREYGTHLHSIHHDNHVVCFRCLHNVRDLASVKLFWSHQPCKQQAVHDMSTRQVYAYKSCLPA